MLPKDMIFFILPRIIFTFLSIEARLLRSDELPDDWDPQKDKRFTVWETTHHMILVLDQGESAAVEIMTNLESNAENARELAYRLYHMCEQKEYTKESQDYNNLVQSWPEISRLARDAGSASAPTGGLRMHDDR